MNASPQQGRALLYLATIFAIASCDRSDTPAAPLRGPASALADLQATFGSTGAMAEARSSHVAVRLHDGRVLVAGGINARARLATAELFDPGTGAWSSVANMNFPRLGHAAVLLGDGRVLVIGGARSNNVVEPAVGGSAEIFDPVAGTWTLTGPLNVPRNSPAAVVLQDGRVLVAGGGDRSGHMWSSAELFDPTSGTWTPTGTLSVGRQAPAGALLPDGRVLLAGGLAIGGLSSAEIFAISTSTNHAPVAVAGAGVTAAEGATVQFDGSASSDLDGDALTFTWDFGDGSAPETGPTPSHTYVDNGNYTVTLTVSDGSLTNAATTTAVITNLLPAVGPISAPVDPVEVGTPVTASASFTDPGLLDTHTASIDWGDGTSSTGLVSGVDGSGSASGSHAYTVAGVYLVTLTVTDKHGRIGQATFEFVIVFEPTSGFVTGGGWTDSPPGAYAADPTLTGKANFGFVARYQPGATVPSGQTEFRFQVAGLNFHSTEYEWLVVSGTRAQFKGSGTLNGSEGFRFMISAVDGDLSQGRPTDGFRIKIWDDTSGGVIYDNQMGDSDRSSSTTALGGGSIVIHR